MKNIVALVDFSDVTPHVTEQASQLARVFGAQLTLLHVVPEEPAVVELGLASPTIMQSPSEQTIAAHSRRLQTLRDSLAETGIDVKTEQLESVGMEKLMQICRDSGAEIIVVGSHHHSTFYDLIVGSFTSDVLKRATCPVLVVPAAIAQRV